QGARELLRCRDRGDPPLLPSRLRWVRLSRQSPSRGLYGTDIWRRPSVAGLAPGRNVWAKGSERRIGVSTIMAPNGTLGRSSRAFGGGAGRSGSCHSERWNTQVESQFPAGACRVPQDEYQTQRVRRRANDTLFEAGSRAPLLVEPGGI